MSSKDGAPDNAANRIHRDAAGQYAQPIKSSDNNGVSSAKPRVLTGKDDATNDKRPPGQKGPDKDWDLNSDQRDIGDGEFHG